MIWPLFLDTAWKSTLLLMLGVLFARLLRNHSAALRHLIWSSALLGLLVLPATRWIAPRVPIPTLALVSQNLSGGIERLSITSVNWGKSVLILWAAGALMILLRLMIGIIRSCRITRQALPINLNGIEVRTCAGVAVPVTTGIFRRRIILPVEAQLWPPERVRLAIAHEMAHVQRRDCLMNVLTEIACAVYWFHPLVWISARNLRREAENACDDQVLAAGADPSDYAGHLVSVARCVKSARLWGAPAAAMVGRSGLERRLVAILDRQRSRRGLTRATAILAAACACGCILLLSPVTPARAQNSEVHRMSEEGVTPPKLIYKVEPDYTQEAKDAGIQGVVVVTLEIDASGNPRDIQIKRSLDEGLDQKAIQAIQQWKFQPGAKNGKHIRVAANIEVNFRLE